ncbi:hypothetical protein H0H92_002641 [Tricholoma furcatifolium]|nr:hypothetical protein H0H92_002641 [Tricholoma furcatifolium]
MSCRFLLGDELGNIKSVSYSPDVQEDVKTTTKTLWTGSSDAVQALAVDNTCSKKLLAAGLSTGAAFVFRLGSNEEPLEEVCHWKETRLKDGQKYIGLEVSEKGVFSCTSNGALRLSSLGCEGSLAPGLSSLPTRLQAWRMSSRHDTFTYGGDEVDVSVWDTNRAFTSHPVSESEGKKRKRDALFPGELWRAKNVQNDNLGLRQPLRITCLTYLSPSTTSHHLAAGTELGNIRRYDTRAARRPVSDWKVAKVGGIRAIERGMNDKLIHEIFTSDYGSNLYALDLRNGKIIYGYHGISGAVTSIAPSPSILASTAQDRFVRIHSTFAPPQEVSKQQEQRGQILDKVFMKSIPTVIIWDHSETRRQDVAAIDDDDVWETMITTETDSDEDSKRKKKR